MSQIVFKIENNFMFIDSSLKETPIHICLKDNFFNFLPRLFTITTKNQDYKFNIDMLKDSSAVIAKQLEVDPKNLQYHLDINDKYNTMQKFQDMYLGKLVKFTINDAKSINKIISALQIQNLPNFMYSGSIPYSTQVKICGKSLNNFIKTAFPESFTIKTKNNEYKCNILGIFTSHVIKEIKEKDPELNEYFYDFDDENKEFQNICDILNFSSVKMTIENIDSLKKISDLQINFILPEINEFYNSIENSVQLIDDKKTIVNSIDEIFYWLHHINELTVENVKNNILKSSWIHTEENVQELVACILQAVRVNLRLHPYLMDLIISLDQSSNSQNDLKILMPFILKQMKFNFYKSYLYCLFFYRMSQKGLISIHEIVDLIVNVKGFLKNEYSKNGIVKPFSQSYFFNIICCFMPELIEIKKLYFIDLIKRISFKKQTFCTKISKIFKFYFPDNIEQFKKMRDLCEPDDEISKAIYYDDVDLLQSIISKSSIDINVNRIPFNFCSPIFFIDKEKSYINYAAENGSIKCFKYLLLNHAEMDNLTFGFAVFGGNVEIIRTVDQQSPAIYDIDFERQYENEIFYKKLSLDYEVDYYMRETYDYLIDQNFIEDFIKSSIIHHRNDLFDWIFENKLKTNEKLNWYLNDIAICSIQNGNVHSFIECVDSGLDLFHFASKPQLSLISIPNENGFYKLSQFALGLFGNLIKKDYSYDPSSIVKSAALFGNISIFYMVYNFNEMFKDCSKALIASIKRENVNIVNRIIENGFVITNDKSFKSIFSSAISLKSSFLFSYLKNKLDFDSLINHFDVSNADIIQILNNGCLAGNFESVKELTEYILKRDPKSDFSSSFINSVGILDDEICQYFIDRNVLLDYNAIFNNAQIVSSIKLKVFVNWFNKSNPELKELVLKAFFDQAIQNGNIDLIKFIMSKKKLSRNALFSAVKSHNVEIVDLILEYNSDSSFINQTSSNGPALNYAITLKEDANDLAIIKRLLSTPGIDPSIYDEFNSTPLLYAISFLNISAVEAILDFYGDKIQSQIFQINKALETMISHMPSCSNNFNNNNNNNNNNNGLDNKYSTNPEKISVIIQKLIQIENVNVNAHCNNSTLLCYACETNNMDLFKALLMSPNINVNLFAPATGNTPLMTAINNNNIQIAKLLIDIPQTDINFRNYNNETALTIAVSKNLEDVVNILITNERFDSDESLLDFAFSISNEPISSILYKMKDLDVNYNYSYVNNTSSILEKQKSIIYETSLIQAVKNKNNEMIDLIISHPSFNENKSQLISAIFTSVKVKDNDIFEKLMLLINNDVNICSQNGESLLHFAVMNDCREITDLILNNENFDPIKNNFVKCFTDAAFLTAKLNEMEQLTEFDEAHFHLLNFNGFLPNGKTFLTSILSTSNCSDVVNFMINHGADPNLPDTYGVYPLQHAINQRLSDFVEILLNNQKVDLSVKIYGYFDSHQLKNASYLHLAALKSSDFIVNQFISRNLIDINMLDDDGETPLMKACRKRDERSIVLLFKCDNLDYRRCNNNGEDALEIARINKLKSKEKRYSQKNSISFDLLLIQPKEKNDYLMSILDKCT